MKHPVELEESQLLAQCTIQRTRRGGPGGQHRNKVESAIVITHEPTGIIGQASERRSQHENRDVAIDRLRLNLALGFRLETDQDRSPSELWRSRVRKQRLSLNAKHADFPLILAEALDFIAAFEFDLAAVAKKLDISTSQLVKLLKSVPAALEGVNRERRARELHPYK